MTKQSLWKGMSLAASLLCIALAPAQAQTNLLRNPGFENPGTYTGWFGDGSFNFAEGWGGWRTNFPSNFDWQNINPLAFPHTEIVYEGSVAQEIARSGGTFTAAAYQQVDNIAQGTTLQANAWVYIENAAGTGAQARIGIGSNVGISPESPSIVWSPWNSAYNSWQQMTVTATVPAGNVTVFIYYTQGLPNGGTGPNRILIDQAGLFATGTGNPNVPTGATAVGGTPGVNVPPPPTSTPVPAFAAFVGRQGLVENGNLVHIVVAGDTLAGIAVAYGTTVTRLRELNNFPGGGGFLQVGQRIIVGDAPPPTPTLAPTATRMAVNPTFVPASTRTGGGGFGFGVPTSVTGMLASATPQATATRASGFSVPTRGIGAIVPTTGALIQPTIATTQIGFTPVNNQTPIAPTVGAVVAVSSPTPEPATNTPEPPTATPEPPTATPEPPTATPEPPTNTPAPTQVIATSEPPTPEQPGVCVLMFDDVNQNRIQNSGEGLLAGGVITLRQGATDVASYETNGQIEPFCFSDLAAGTYTAIASAPQGYGLTTPASLVVSVQTGTRFVISFGAAQGVAVAQAATPELSPTPATTVGETPAEGNDGLVGIAGILVLVAAGVILLGGVIVALIARRLG